MKYLLTPLFMLLLTAVIYAQTATPTPTATISVYEANNDCGNGLPCGQIPWSLASLPILESPTPIPLVDSSAQVGDTATPTPDFLAELTAVVDLSGQLRITGTPFDFEITEEAEYATLAENSSLVFGYTKSIFIMDFGVITPLFTFFATTMTLTFLLKISTYMLPIIGVIAGLLRKIIELIPGF